MKTTINKPTKSPIKIRFKELADGCKSIYLDIYIKGKRKYEFLKLYIHPGTDEDVVFANAEAMRMAEEILQERLRQIEDAENTIAEKRLSQTNGGDETKAEPDEKTKKARIRAKRTSREPVTLREKELKDGRKSLYLDIYFRGERKYQFLKMYLFDGEDEANEIVLRQAIAIKEQKLLELQSPTPDRKPEEIEKPKVKFSVVLAWRFLKNGDKSYYLSIKQNGQTTCEPLYLYCPANATEAEAKRIKNKAKVIKRKREEELRNGTFYQRPSAKKPYVEFGEDEFYKEYKEKRRAETEILAVSSELKHNSRTKEPVRIRFKELANGNKSIYLAINYNGRRSYDYLKLYLVPETDSTSRLQNKQTMEAAYAIKAQRILEITNGTGLIKKGKTTKIRLVDWMRIYGNRQDSMGKREVKRWVRSTLGAIERFKGGKDILISQINHEWLNDFMVYLLNEYVTYKKTRLAKSTADNYMRCIRTALNLAVTEGLISSNPILTLDRSMLQAPPAQREFLTIEEIQKLIDTPCRRDDYKQAFLFACFCGLRISDIRNLKWGDLFNEGDKVYLRITQVKTRQPLLIPLSKQAQKWMPKRGEASDLENIFPPLSRNMMCLTQWAKKAGINKHVTFHVSRHTFATLELTLGADIFTTSKLLGHTNVKTTQIYAKIVNSKKEEAVSLLDSAFE